MTLAAGLHHNEPVTGGICPKVTEGNQTGVKLSKRYKCRFGLAQQWFRCRMPVSPRREANFQGHFVRRIFNPAFLFAALMLAALCAPLYGMDPVAVPGQSRVVKKRVRRHRVRWNPVFRPSRESLLLQNAEVDRMDLPRIQDDDELETLKASRELVPIVETEALRFDPRLDPDRRYCRPWTRDFVRDMSVAYFEAFGQQIQINSAVRTVKIQKKLRRHNRNAAPEKGELASSHLAGTTVDIQRRGLSPQQIKWVQQYMMPLKELGLIEPEEERRQWVFHVMVSDRYSQPREGQELATSKPVNIQHESEALAEAAGLE